VDVDKRRRRLGVCLLSSAVIFLVSRLNGTSKLKGVEVDYRDVGRGAESVYGAIEKVFRAMS